LDGFLNSREAYAQDCGLRASTQLLLELLSHLTGDFDEYRCRLLLVASGRIDPFDSIDKYLRNAAKISGCNIDGRTHDQLRGAVERSVSVLLTGVSDLPICDENDRASMKASHVYADDDYVPGAVVLSCRRQKIESGIIVRVEQQAWNAMLSRWDKQLVVRFSDRERQLSPHTPGCQNTLPMPIVVRAEDTRAVLKSLNGRGGTPQILPQAGPYWNDRKAS
jgi:hypothetical protein